MKIEVSIIILNYNSQDVILNCLTSIQKHYRSKLKDTYEIIVVDNHSSDNSVKNIKALYPGVLIIENDSNVGFSKGNNQGVKKAHGKYVLFLNPDTLFTENALGPLVTFMDNHKDVGVATCKVVLQNGKIDDACHRGFPTPWRALTHFTGLGVIFPNSMLFNGYHLAYKSIRIPHEIDACAGAFLLIRSSIGRRLRWLDEDYYWYGEDLDLCYRVKQLGYKVMFLPQYKIQHIKGISSGIKKHSKKFSIASKQTQITATKSRFEVMRLFYNKHYLNYYPNWLTKLVFLGIDMKEQLTRWKL